MKARRDEDLPNLAARAAPRLFGAPAFQLLLIIGVACVLNYVWLSYDRTPPHWDSANHLMSALKFRQVFSDFFHGSYEGQGGIPSFLKDLVFVNDFVYPPLFHLTASLLSPTLAIPSLVMVNCLFLVVLVLSVYGIGRRLHGHLAGILSAVLIVTYPMVFILSRQFMIDYALLALTALSGFLLLASDEFRSPRETYLFGISAGLGMLTKPLYASFVLAPACYTLARALLGLRRSGERRVRGQALLRLMLALLIAGFLASLWYLPNFRGVRRFPFEAGANKLGFDVWDVNSLVYYFNVLMIDQIGVPFTVLLLFGLGMLRKRLAPSGAGFLLAWLIGIYVLGTLAPYKGTGQDLAILIPISVVSAVGLAGLTRFRRVTCAATIVLAAVQFLVLSLPYSVLGDKIGGFRWAVHYQRFPSLAEWPIEEALTSLGNRPLTVAILSDHAHINGGTVEYYARMLRLPFRVKGRYWGTDSKELLDADAIFDKSDWVPPGPTRGLTLAGVDTSSLGLMYTAGRCDQREKPNEPYWIPLSRRDHELSASSPLQGRRLFRQFPLPDGSALLVYR